MKKQSPIFRFKSRPGHTKRYTVALAYLSGRFVRLPPRMEPAVRMLSVMYDISSDQVLRDIADFELNSKRVYKAAAKKRATRRGK